jgi:hypothetical protein
MGNCSECINSKKQTQLNFADEGDLMNRKSKSTVGVNNFQQDQNNECDFNAGRNLNKIILIQRTVLKYLKILKSEKNELANSFYKSFDVFNYNSSKGMNNNANEKEMHKDQALNDNDYQANGNNMIVKFDGNDEEISKKYESNFTSINGHVKNRHNIDEFKLKNNMQNIFDIEDKDLISRIANRENTDKPFDLKYIKMHNGSIYLGNAIDNKADGFGILIHAEGDVYSGYWKGDEADGVGKYTNLNGCSYHGFWKNNKRNGYGIEMWPKGSCYEGYFFNGFKHSVGVLKLEDGSFFEGDFNNNDMTGIGTFYFKDKRIFYGEWKNNKMNGYGILSWNDGKRFEGSFVDDKKDGFGIFYANSKIYIANWKNSKLDGDVIIIQYGTVTKSFWNMGKKTKTFPVNHNHPFDRIAEEIINSDEFHEIKNFI